MKKLFATIFLTAAMLSAMAQGNDPVVFEINGKKYHKSQFLNEYLRSVGNAPAADLSPDEKGKALREYAELYVNFHTKLADAYAQGYDTLRELNSELSTYRKELAAPYLIDSATLRQLLLEAYERNHYVLHAAHILVPCAETALPADTLKAYRQALDLYHEALTAEDFYSVAQKEMRRQRLADRDPLVREKADQVNPMEGDLGCFTVFDMIYAFENAAYGMTPGEVRPPIRTRYGYHVVKLFDKYAYYGKAQLAHIWVSGSDPSAKGKINAAYRNLQGDMDFGVVAKNYSDDRTTASNGGIMPELPPSQLPFDYVGQIAKGLKVGEYSQPFQSRYGWHIIKLLKQETMPAFESMIPYYRSRMTRGERATKPQHIFVEQCKERYGFVDYTATKTSKKKKAPYAASLQAVRAVVTDSVFSAIFNYDSNSITDMRPLFRIGDREYNSRQFARHIYDNKKVRPLCNLDVFVAERYRDFVSDMVLAYADSRLETDNPEFGALIDEYRHGLMIFNYNDQMVWTKALQDTVGFERFYDEASRQHRFDRPGDAVYFWNERVRVHAYTVSDSTLLPRGKALKVMARAQKKGWNSERVCQELAAKARPKDSLQVEHAILVPEKGSQNLLTDQEWAVGTYVHALDSGTYQILVVEQLLAPELKTRDEARGYYLNDFQNYLEEQNNARLRQKYGVKVYREVLDQLTY